MNYEDTHDSLSCSSLLPAPTQYPGGGVAWALLPQTPEDRALGSSVDGRLKQERGIASRILCKH